MTGEQVASGKQMTFIIKGINHAYDPGYRNGRRQPPAVIKLDFLYTISHYNKLIHFYKSCIFINPR